MADKNTRLKEQRSTVTIVLSIAALVLFIISFFIRNDRTQNLLRMMGWVFVLATIVFRLFKGEFGYKPTREEIEEKMFGTEKSEIEK
jgi:uncharacterized membrane protein YwaF